jgi:hypothetical protein
MVLLGMFEIWRHRLQIFLSTSVISFDPNVCVFRNTRAVLRGLHLYNIERIDNTSLCGALSACPSLLDLEIIGL